MKAWALALATALLAACSLGPATKDVPATYDFGAQRNHPGEPKIRASLLVHGIAPAAWLDTPAVVYRLNYEDGARQQAYALTRWAAPPASLLAQRLRARLAAASESGVVSLADNARADYALRVELDDFSQVFDSLEASRAVVVARASLVDTVRRTVVAQKTFSIERAAPSANAQGGIRALTAAGDELIEAIAAWTAANLARDKK
jgi:cholesterol transport system auxiliary component